MGMELEVVARVTYTVHLSDEDIKKVKKYLKDNEEDLPSFSDEENLCYAVRMLYEQEKISLYDEGKATESDFSTEEFNWSEFESKTVEQILSE